MNNYILGGICFALGAAVGGLTAALVAKKKYERALHEEIEAISDTNKELIKLRRKKIAEPVPGSDDIPENGERPHVYVKNDKEIGGAETEEEQYESAASEYKEQGFQPAMSFPHIISPEEFDEVNGYDKKTVLFYEGDEVAICSATGVELDLDEDLGNGFNLLSEDNAAEDGMIYIRNPRQSTDYAVDIYPNSSGVTPYEEDSEE